MRKDFLSLYDFSKEELNYFLQVAADLKANRLHHGEPLRRRTVALLFEKPSNRTRVSFDVGAKELGAHTIYLSGAEISLGHRESVADVAHVLSRYVHVLVVRTFAQDLLVQLAKVATIPVINGLTDFEHPCQILSDIFTIQEKLGKDARPTVVYVGDGNNILHSWLYGAATMGIHLVYSTPRVRKPQDAVVKAAWDMAKASGATLIYEEDPKKAVRKADVIYTDVWVSMGQEHNPLLSREIFLPYQVNEFLVKHAPQDALLMHCLPAHRGNEVDEHVLDRPQAIIFDQAENRLHVQKAIMQLLVAG